MQDAGFSAEEYETAAAVFRAYGVDPRGMSRDELRLARRAIARISHPDHGGGDGQMTEVNVAFDTLVRLADLVEEGPREGAARSRKQTQEQAARSSHNSPSRNKSNGPYTPPPTSRINENPTARPAAWMGSGGR